MMLFFLVHCLSLFITIYYLCLGFSLFTLYVMGDDE